MIEFLVDDSWRVNWKLWNEISFIFTFSLLGFHYPKFYLCIFIYRDRVIIDDSSRSIYISKSFK